MKSDNNDCPKCGSQDILDFVYRLRTYDLFKEAKENKIILGGCIVDSSYP